MRAFFVAISLLSLAACANDKHLSESSPPRKPVAVGTKPADTGPDRGPLCVGVCMGPHIDLGTGQVKMFGLGPGINFF